MNTNKQLNKGKNMRKIAMIVGLLSILSVNANAGTWTHTPTSDLGYMGGATQWKSTYNY